MRPQPAVTAIVRNVIRVALVSAVALSVLGPSPALAGTVFLDAGHGGRYPGAVYVGVE
ncbi:MAG: hypothetical protein LLG08_06455 [Actinomycetia bacterium]|nr:hypothetical protein [Actinomycetes bacterium]